MNEPMLADQQTPEPEQIRPARKLPRLRFPAVCLLIFWLLYFGVSALDKPYFVGFMYGLASTGLITLFFFLWWWCRRLSFNAEEE